MGERSGGDEDLAARLEDLLSDEIEAGEVLPGSIDRHDRRHRHRHPHHSPVDLRRRDALPRQERQHEEHGMLAYGIRQMGERAVHQAGKPLAAEEQGEREADGHEHRPGASRLELTGVPAAPGEEPRHGEEQKENLRCSHRDRNHGGEGEKEELVEARPPERIGRTIESRLGSEDAGRRGPGQA
jgi:hypothetical protein